MDRALKKLQKLGLAHYYPDKSVWKGKHPLIHLWPNSQLSEQNHANWWALAATQKPLNDPLSFRYSTAICADATTKNLFISKFRALLAELHSVVKNAPEERVFHVGIDVFGL